MTQYLKIHRKVSFYNRRCVDGKMKYLRIVDNWTQSRKKKSELHVPKKKMIDFQTLWDNMIDKFTSPVFWL